MAKFKGKGVVIAGLLAGAASFLSKKENRDKAMGYLNIAKATMNKSGGVQGFMDEMKNGSPTNSPLIAQTDGAKAAQHDDIYIEESLQDIASTAGSTNETILRGNKMVSEGAVLTTIEAYNEKQDKES